MDNIELVQLVVAGLDSLVDLVPVLVGIVGILGTVAGAFVAGLIAAKLQAQRLTYEDSVRIDDVRRALIGRFDQVRREVYAQYIGTAMKLCADAAELLSTGDPQAAAAVRQRLYSAHTRAMTLHGEVTIVGTSRVGEHAHVVMDVLRKITFGSMDLRRTWQPSSEDEKLPSEFLRWGEELDTAQQELIWAIRKELRIVEILRDPLIDEERASTQSP